MIALLSRLSFHLARLGAGLSALIVLGMTGHILYEIALRHLLRSSTYVLDEFVGYSVAAITFLTLAFALEKDAHIRIGLITDRLGERARRLVDAICCLLGLATVMSVMHFLNVSMQRNISRGSVSATVAQVPMWMPQAVVLAGLGLLAFSLFTRFLRAAAGRTSETGGGGSLL